MFHEAYCFMRRVPAASLLHETLQGDTRRYLPAHVGGPGGKECVPVDVGFGQCEELAGELCGAWHERCERGNERQGG